MNPIKFILLINLSCGVLLWLAVRFMDEIQSFCLTHQVLIGSALVAVGGVGIVYMVRNLSKHGSTIV